MTRTDRSTGTGTAIAVTAIVSVQFGAAVAVTLFPVVGPVGTLSLRFLGAATVLVLLTRPWRVRWSGHDLRTVLAFGLAFVVMNLSLYVAMSRLPLATAVTLEFLGPLGVAIATASTWRQRGWALPAAAGVLLIGGSLHVADLLGVGAAIVAALAWASYILLSRRMGTSDAGLAGLALATVLGAVLVVPFGVAGAGAALVHPRTLLLGLAVGVACSAIPYTLDLLALRRLSTSVFGVLTSLNPAMAAAAGLVVLQELPPQRQLVGIALVVLASAGATLTGRRRTSGAPSSDDGPVAAAVAVPAAGAGEPDRLPAARAEDPHRLG